MAEAPDSQRDVVDPEEDPRRRASAGQQVRAFIWDTIKTWGPALLAVLLIRSVLAEPFRIPSGSMVPTLAIGDHILVTKYSYGLRIPLTRIPLTDISVPERGDIVVFVYPGSDDSPYSYWFDLPIPPFATLDYVKRVVGLPGETIEVRDDVLYIDGVPQSRELQGRLDFVDDRCRTNPTRQFEENLDGIKHPALQSTSYGLRMADFKPTVVPDGHFFVMGDNRDHSADSRVWGFVPVRNVKGKARFVWLSYDTCAGADDKSGTLASRLPDMRWERFGLPLH